MSRTVILILVTLSFALPVVAANYASNWTSVALGSTAEKFGFDGYRDTAYAHYQELHSSHAELEETAKVAISEPGSVLKAAYTGIKETGQGLLRLEPRAVADVEAFKTEGIKVGHHEGIKVGHHRFKVNKHLICPICEPIFTPSTQLVRCLCLGFLV